MKENTKKGVSRREFLGLSALGLASLTILPSWAMNGVRIAPSDRVVLGFIGLGQQALSDFKGFAACPGVQVAACCDVDTMKTERFRRRVAEWQASKGMNQRCDQYTRICWSVRISMLSRSLPRTIGMLWLPSILVNPEKTYIARNRWLIRSPKAWLW